MATLFLTVVSIFAVIIGITAAPSDINKIKEEVKVESTGLEADKIPLSLIDETKKETNTTQGQRQKRFFNYYGYGVPPMNPLIYPNFPSRADPYNTQYSYEDPIAQIHKRLQDIVAITRNNYNYNVPPPPPPSTNHFPLFFPVIYIPFVGCGCAPGQTPNTQGSKPGDNGTDPGISNRFPEMEDERQNWGLVVNDTEMETDDEPEDFTRPISFEPIRPDRPMNRPPPALDHGSTQAGSNGTNNEDTTTTTTIRPESYPPSSINTIPSSEPPSVCDGAILSCCHQPQVTYDCFASQGCPDPTSYGNPCEIQVILRVINKFQTYYRKGSG